MVNKNNYSDFFDTMCTRKKLSAEGNAFVPVNMAAVKSAANQHFYSQVILCVLRFHT